MADQIYNFQVPCEIQGCHHPECAQTTPLHIVDPEIPKPRTPPIDQFGQDLNIVNQGSSIYANRNLGTTSWSGLGPGVLYRTPIPVSALQDLAHTGREQMRNQYPSNRLGRPASQCPGAMGIFQGPGMIADSNGSQRSGTQVYLHSSTRGSFNAEGQHYTAMTLEVEGQLADAGADRCLEAD